MQQNSQRYKTKMIVEAGLAIAMAQILGMFVLYQMPQGGAVKAANLVPLLIFAYRWGGKAGIVTGVAYGILHFIVGMKFTIHYASILLDYLIAYGAVGLAGYFKGGQVKATFGAVNAMIVKFLASVISGAVVFGSYAPAGQNPWIYSIVYNATYMVPDMFINLVVVALFYAPIMKGINSVSPVTR